jgi:hypothetical protein
MLHYFPSFILILLIINTIIIILKVRVKVKLSLCSFLTEHHAIKAYWGMDVYLYAFFDLGTRWR